MGMRQLGDSTPIPAPLFFLKFRTLQTCCITVGRHATVIQAHHARARLPSPGGGAAATTSEALFIAAWTSTGPLPVIGGGEGGEGLEAIRREPPEVQPLPLSQCRTPLVLHPKRVAVIRPLLTPRRPSWEPAVTILLSCVGRWSNVLYRGNPKPFHVLALVGCDVSKFGEVSASARVCERSVGWSRVSGWRWSCYCKRMRRMWIADT
jgi:hypothetical protein